MRVMDVLSFPHQATRLVFDAGQPYEKFRSRYEAAVPAEYGLGLDRQLTRLLEALGVEPNLSAIGDLAGRRTG
jgi:hypothetical protein